MMLKISFRLPLSFFLFALSFSALFIYVEPKIGSIGHHFSSNSEGNVYLVTGGLYRENSSLYYSSGTYLRDQRGFNWEKQPEGLSPGPRTDSASVFLSIPSSDQQSEKDDEYFYIFGGENWNGVLSDQYLFNLKTRQWKRLPSSSSSFSSSSSKLNSQAFPLKRAGHSLTWDKESKKVIMFGGRYISSSRLSFYNQSHVDPSLPSPTLPEWTSDRKYAGFSDLWEFSPLTNKWIMLWSGTNSVTEPLPREQATLFSLDSTVFMFGGLDPRSGFRFNDFWVFNRDQWAKLGPVEDKSSKFDPFYPPPLSHALFIPRYLSVMINNIEKKILIGGILYGGVTGGLNQHLLCGQAYRFLFPSIQRHFSDSTNLNNLDVPVSYFSFLTSRDSVLNIQWSTYNLHHIKSYGLESHQYIESSAQLLELGGVSLEKQTIVYDAAAHIDTQPEEFLPSSLSLPSIDFFNYTDTLTSVYSTLLSLSSWGVTDKHQLYPSIRRLKITNDYGYLLEDL